MAVAEDKEQLSKYDRHIRPDRLSHCIHSGLVYALCDTGQITEMPAASIGTVVNTVGARDALFSAFLHHYAKGLHPVEALRRAQVFAAWKITASGSSNGFVGEQEIEEWLSC